MSATNFSLDQLTLAYSEEDYKPQSREPAIDKWYEFAVNSAKVEVAKQGHLSLKVEAQALDGSGKDMFKKYLNVPVPVSIGDQIPAHQYAKGLWLANLVAMYPEHASYDHIVKDSVTQKLKYYKGDEQLTGQAYEKATIEQNKAVGIKATDAATLWLEHGDGVSWDELHGKRFFARIVKSKDGKYTNIERPYAVCPEGEEICYDRKEALKG